MILNFEPNYGADYDGNRGIPMKFYELERSDDGEIIEKIKEAIEEMRENGELEDDEMPETITITMICPIDDEDIDFDITVKDYIKFGIVI